MSAVLQVQHPLPAPAKHEAVYVDLFCGAGGSTTGAMSVLREMYPKPESIRAIVVNHDPLAIATHKRNHPDAEHHDCDIETLDPRDVLQGERITVLWASAPCTHFSKARGGTPRSEQKRATPDYILRWIEAGQPDIYIEENVWDITSWGPLDAQGKPIKKLKGTLFRKHLTEIEALGYRAEYRKLNAANYGDPTTRERFILMAVRDGGPIPWPRLPHSKGGKVPDTQPWVGADSFLDREAVGKSIYGRKTKDGRDKPVAQKTRNRIGRGFLLKGSEWRHVARAVETNAGPIPLVDALDGLTVEEAERLLTCLLGERVEFTLGQNGGAIPRDSTAPIATVPAGGALRRVGAELIVSFDRPETNRSLARQGHEPTAAVTTNERLGEVSARVLIPPLGYYARGGMANKPREPTEPLSTVLATRGAGHAADARVIVGAGGPEWSAEPRDSAHPLRGLTADPHFAVAEPVVLVPNFGERKGQAPRVHDVRNPAPAVTSHGAGQLARAVLSAYYGKGTPQSILLPLRTITTKDRHALAEAVIRFEDLVIDVLLRMLTVAELAAAMSFPKWYVFLGKKRDQLRQIGNAVPVRMSRAIVEAALRRARVIAQARLSDFGGAAA